MHTRNMQIIEGRARGDGGPASRHLVVAHQDSDTLAVYVLDTDSGLVRCDTLRSDARVCEAACALSACLSAYLRVSKRVWLVGFARDVPSSDCGRRPGINCSGAIGRQRLRLLA